MACWGLCDSQTAFLEAYGYLIVPDVLTPAELDAIAQDYGSLLDETANEMLADGRLKTTYDGLPFSERYTRLLTDCPDLYRYLGISLPLVRDARFMPADARVHASPVMFRLLTNPRILDLVESVVGPDIYANPTQHKRIKPPQREVPVSLQANTDVSTTIWHQDQSGYLSEASDSQILTVWVAITDATVENGCLICVAGSHKARRLTLHCPQKARPLSTYIPESLIDPNHVVALTARRGSIILLDRYTEHASLPNRSNSIRWSFDLRYNPVSQPCGRPAFPGFVARSKTNPGSVLTDPAAWKSSWVEAHRRILSGEERRPLFQDMSANQAHPLCA